MTAVFADPISKLHDTGYGHPERAARFDAALKGVPADLLRTPPPREATLAELQLCHTAEYLRAAEREIASGAPQLSTGDTDVAKQSWEVALRATGTVLHAVDQVASGALANAFCIVRPPGHHATPARGMGFCIVNHIAIAARYAQRQFGYQRVLIADWDVHHGNGTQDIFYEDGSVFFFSTHQSPWYPGTGAATETGSGEGKGATMNCPFPAGSEAKKIGGAFEEQLAPAMDRFRPDLVLLSAGFDSRAGDPLGKFLLTDEDFAALTRMARKIANRHAEGRLVSVLEGGYSLSGLEHAVRAHTAALL